MTDIRDPDVYGDEDGDDADSGAGSADELAAALPGLVRLAANTWWRTANWSFRASFTTAGRVASAVASGRPPGELLTALAGDARAYFEELLSEADGRVPPPWEDAPADGEEEVPEERPVSPADADRDDLRRLGADLLRLSADEARILRMLALQGPQPSVDVRSSRALNISSELVAPGLTMIGAEAGCRHMGRVPAYLNNLERLGLISLSREPMGDPLIYQVLEAQPDVLDALKGSGRGKTVRRSIHLTPFGTGFCELCLPLEESEPAE